MKHVLVVDDSPEVTTYLEMILPAILADYTVRVVSAAQSQEAMAHVEAQPPDLVLLDIHLGDQCGLDLVRPLKAQVPRSPIIVISADPDWRLAREALLRGVFGFWQKGREVEELATLVRTAQAIHAMERGTADDVMLFKLCHHDGDVNLTAESEGFAVEDVTRLVVERGVPVP